MKKFLFTIILILMILPTPAMTDELRVPFSCWPKELQTEFKQKGLKLDLSPNDRTEESWGYVVNKGSDYVLYTYSSIQSDEFQMIQDIVFKVELAKRKN